jgi:zinc finger protein
MAFTCDKCGFQNNEMQSAGSIAPRGSRLTLRLTKQEDLARTVVKADTATVKFIELDVEVPPGRGQITNVEGLLTTIMEDLESGQEVRKQAEPETFEKLEEIIKKGQNMLDGGSFPFRVMLDDPAGNSFIGFDARDGVGKLERRDYARTPEQNEALGLSGDSATGAGADPYAIQSEGVASQGILTSDDDIVPNEVYSFPASCPECFKPCTTHMKMVDIPHFKQVVIMSTVCQSCGYRSSDVKTGGEIPDKGKKITLQVRGGADLARDILKSESCDLACPELSLEVQPGTLGGRFTTVEGLLTQIRDDLRSQMVQLGYLSNNGRDEVAEEGGDSFTEEEKKRWKSFFENLDAAIKGNRTFTLVLRDPLASSYVQSLADGEGEMDDQVKVEEYERTAEEEEDLGLNDMQTEGYEEPPADNGG